LIPNLVAVVQGYARHERELFASIARLRNAALASGGVSQQRSRDEDRLCLGLRDVFALAESYPDLRADGISSRCKMRSRRPKIASQRPAACTTATCAI
jgi:hypothetical protein